MHALHIARTHIAFSNFVRKFIRELAASNKAINCVYIILVDDLLLHGGLNDVKYDRLPK